MGHDCSVPVIKPNCVKKITPPLGSKVKYLNFAITVSVVNILTEILHADRGTIDMEHIRLDFSFKSWIRIPGWTCGLGRGQTFFSEYGYVVYQIKGNELYNNILSNIFTKQTPSTPEMGSKGPKDFFSKSSHVAYQIKGNDEA